MHVLAWIAPATWPSVIDATRARPHSDEITLVAVEDPGESLPPGLWGGLMGRAHRPEPESIGLPARQARSLLTQAEQALGRPCMTQVLTGRTERVITAAAAAADLLILARDGDRSRLGPASLGRHARFIIDHTPCTVEIIWPGQSPRLDTIPPAPPPH